ncbi:MAG: response regulator transcription factor [Verrucomicrobia bacterium]|nr:response regulator transcription factor [Verrucomicrobiota bacterium]
MPRILVAEDDPAIREGLLDALESEGYRVSAAENGKTALALLQNGDVPDLLVLDIMMPGLSGYDVCRELRKTNAQLPVLMLTAKGEEIDKVLGLELGADDYMTKPFGVREFLARIHALLRRCHPGPASGEADKAPFAFGPAQIDPRTHTGYMNGEAFDLSPREMKLLRVFAAHPGEALGRDELLNQVWGMNYYGTTRTLDQHIAQLRKKIEPERENPSVILTVHGLGYKYQGFLFEAQSPTGC